MPVEGIETIAQNPGWLYKELKILRDRTMAIALFTLFFGGFLLGYFLLADLIMVITDPVSKVTHAHVGESNLKIDVETKKPMLATVEYGPSEEVLNESSVGDNYQREHSVLLKGLLPEKSHTYRFILYDEKGKSHKSDFYFTE